MSQQVISYADLTIINNALRSIRSDVSGIYSELGDLNLKQDQIESELVKLADAFESFVEADLKHKSLQLAETRQGNLKQDWQIKFGYYAEVRRMATGILQGVDTGVVGDDTLRFTTEEVMIKAPGYWLAPALIALAGWIRNDKISSDIALKESLKRDDYKTTIFFMLVMRRLSRNETSLKWLERYFMHQNPHNIDREFIVILEAVTTGVFPPASRNLMMRNVKSWLEQLTRGDQYVNEQKIKWLRFFEAKGYLPESKYLLLSKFSTNWDRLEDSLKEMGTHGILQAYFRNIFASSSVFSKSIKVQLDEILSLLVSNFDDEELPLQQQIRLNELIIQSDGDKHAAQAMMDAEKHIFDEKVDFLQMLTNAAFDPDLSGATKATQVLAVSISQPWIIEAYDTFTANSRNKVPVAIELSIDGFNTSTLDGSDETEQLVKHEKYWSDVLRIELNKLAFPYAFMVLGIMVGLAGLWCFNVHFLAGICCLAIGIFFVWNAIDTHKKNKQNVKDVIQGRQVKSKEVLRGCIAETVDYRKESAMEDAKAERLREFLDSIKAEDFSSVSIDTKSILQTN